MNSEEVSRSRRCPMCGYDLRGLGEEYRCPECGFDYDAHTTVIQLGEHFLEPGIILNVLALLFIVWLFWGKWSKFGYLLWIPVGIGVFHLIRRIYRCVGLERERRMCVLNRRGIQFKHPEIPATFIPWDKFAGASYSWVTGNLYFTLDSGEKRFLCKYDVLGSVAKTRQFVNEINRLKGVYSSMTPHYGDLQGTDDISNDGVT